MPFPFSPVRSLCLVVATVAGSTLHAANHVVNSLAALQAQLKTVTAGDTLTLQDGVYATTAAISVKCVGTAEQPITITAESIGGVEIAGAQGFNVAEPAAYVVISGFKFTHAAGKNTIGFDTSHVRFTHNTFRCSGDGPYLAVNGDDAQVDHNDFGDKSTVGSMVAVGGVGGQVARRVWIHHNYLHDFSPPAGTSVEMIRFGLSALGASIGAGLVEHNLLVRCRGESEMISNRSSGNTYRYNTLLESPTAQFSLRHGNDCLVYGNTLRGIQSLRVYGDRHQVFSNYFEKNYIGINLGNGSAEVSEGGSPGGHDRPDDCVIAFNTLVDNRTHYQMSRRSPTALGATNTTFANNLIVDGGVAAKIEGPNPGAVWSGNLVWTKGGPGDLPAAGFAKEDPLLVADDTGIRRPQPGSPALESAAGTFPMVTVDLDGQPRPEKKSKGADEPGTAPATAHVLTVNDVGPLADPR